MAEMKLQMQRRVGGRAREQVWACGVHAPLPVPYAVHYPAARRGTRIPLGWSFLLTVTTVASALRQINSACVVDPCLPNGVA